jgi:hypothetical protein
MVSQAYLQYLHCLHPKEYFSADNITSEVNLDLIYSPTLPQYHNRLLPSPHSLDQCRNCFIATHARYKHGGQRGHKLLHTFDWGKAGRKEEIFHSAMQSSRCIIQAGSFPKEHQSLETCHIHGQLSTCRQREGNTGAGKTQRVRIAGRGGGLALDQVNSREY